MGVEVRTMPLCRVLQRKVTFHTMETDVWFIYTYITNAE